MQAAAGASEKEPLVVTFTVTDPTTLTCTADKTVEEVDAAYKQKIPVYGSIALGDQSGFLSCTYSSGGYLFSGLAGETNTTMGVAYNEGVCAAWLNSLLVAEVSLVSSSPGTFEAGGRIIRKVKDPEQANDAATKGYADKILTAGNGDSIVIQSSTPNSNKKFRITVDDAGAIAATEVVS
mgnify:CR=1 FL=1